MTLTGRVSLALLSTLALALAVASAGVYWINRSALHERVDQRLDGALDALGALIELEPGGLEWDTENRSVTIGGENHDDEVRWLVMDGGARRVADSGNLGLLPAPTIAALVAGAAESRDVRRADTLNSAGDRWRRMTVRRVAPPPAALPTTSSHPKAPVVHDQLTVVAALPLRSVDRELDRLLAGSASFALAILVAAALLSSRLCRKALAPLDRMERSAGEITAADLKRRLPSPGTSDGLDRLCTTINDLLARVEHAYSTQRRLAADASHQLRTPLAAQISQLEVTLRRDRPASEYREVLPRVLARAQQMGAIVDGLLVLARVEAEGGRPQTETFDLGAWLRSHVDTWSLEPRHADFRVRVPNEALPVLASQAWLAQVVDALLENAAKYSAAGTPIEIEAFRSGDEALIEVRDHGIGMTDEDRLRAFEPFYRATEARRGGSPGVGLGLSIAARLADAMGGRVTVRSTLGVGSTFAIGLPVADRGRDASA